MDQLCCARDNTIIPHVHSWDAHVYTTVLWTCNIKQMVGKEKQNQWAVAPPSSLLTLGLALYPRQPCKLLLLQDTVSSLQEAPVHSGHQHVSAPDSVGFQSSPGEQPPAELLSRWLVKEWTEMHHEMAGSKQHNHKSWQAAAAAAVPFGFTFWGGGWIFDMYHSCINPGDR